MQGQQPVALRGLDLSKLRVPAESSLLVALVGSSRRTAPLPEGAYERQELLRRAVLLSEAMAPGAHARMNDARRVLGIDTEVELYQRAHTQNNAGLLSSQDPIRIEITGRLLEELDPGTLLAVFGHELGHHLAHTARSPFGEVRRSVYPPALAATQRRFRIACELTADRFGLLVSQDLDAALRLEMMLVAGVSSPIASWDTRSYLSDCRALMEGLLVIQAEATGTSHPEHSLRAYAEWLFSESDLYRELTGLGPGTRRIDEVNAILEVLLGLRPPSRPRSESTPRPALPLDSSLRGAGRAAVKVLDEVTGSVGRTARTVAPELSRLSRFAGAAASRLLGRSAAAPSPSPPESQPPQPTAEDEALERRFEELERRFKDQS